MIHRPRQLDPDSVSSCPFRLLRRGPAILSDFDDPLEIPSVRYLLRTSTTLSAHLGVGAPN